MQKLIHIISALFSIILITSIGFATDVEDYATIHPYTLSYTHEEVNALDNPYSEKMVSAPITIVVEGGPQGAFTRGQMSKNGVFQINGDTTVYVNFTNRLAYGIGTGYAATFDNGTVRSTLVYSSLRYRFSLDYQAESIPFFLVRFGQAFNQAGANCQVKELTNSIYFSMAAGSLLSSGLLLELNYNYFTKPLMGIVPGMPESGTQSIGVMFGYEFAL
ncbi:MAG: hypothetical protein NTX05_00165 [Fusobacteria bacterium]|nr:hypothetical protein [Fusobacteriota bacterium]